MLKVSLTEYCYIYITRTDFELLFYQLFRVRVVLSRWTFYKKLFFFWDIKQMWYIRNWWTIPLRIEREFGSVTVVADYLSIDYNLTYQWYKLFENFWIFLYHSSCKVKWAKNADNVIIIQKLLTASLNLCHFFIKYSLSSSS